MPASWALRAAARPAGPAPTTRTSQSGSGIGSPGAHIHPRRAGNLAAPLMRPAVDGYAAFETDAHAAQRTARLAADRPPIGTLSSQGHRRRHHRPGGRLHRLAVDFQLQCASGLLRPHLPNTANPAGASTGLPLTFSCNEPPGCSGHIYQTPPTPRAPPPACRTFSCNELLRPHLPNTANPAGASTGWPFTVSFNAPPGGSVRAGTARPESRASGPGSGRPPAARWPARW